jgi:phosphatidate cytidylyltransferase
MSPAIPIPRRVVGAVAVAIPTAIAALLGDWVFTIFIFAVIGLGAHELIRLLCAAGYQASPRVTYLTTFAVMAGVRFPEIPLLLPALSLVLMGSFAAQLRHPHDRRIGDWAVAFAGGLYLGWTGGHLAEIRQLSNGAWWLALAIGATWAADSGAFIVGKLIGRHKLAPEISPGKTWEGYFGGMVFGGLAGWLIGVISPLGVWLSVLGGITIGAFSVFGDLIESMIKRQANAKDSGRLIPGHGGILDRIDSLLWSGVIVFYIAQYAPR